MNSAGPPRRRQASCSAGHRALSLKMQTIWKQRIATHERKMVKLMAKSGKRARHESQVGSPKLKKMLLQAQARAPSMRKHILPPADLTTGVEAFQAKSTASPAMSSSRSTVGISSTQERGSAQDRNSTVLLKQVSLPTGAHSSLPQAWQAYRAGENSTQVGATARVRGLVSSITQSWHFCHAQCRHTKAARDHEHILAIYRGG